MTKPEFDVIYERHLCQVSGLRDKGVQHFLNQVRTILLSTKTQSVDDRSQSRTSESVSLFEQAQRSFAASSKGLEVKKKIANELKKPNVVSDYGSDDWFDHQTYSDFADTVESRNPDIKIDKEIMDLAFEFAHT